MTTATQTASQGTGRGTSPLPLCVDLDGTLIRADLVWESLLQLARRRPAALAAVPLWLLRGRAYAKQRIAELVHIDPAILPYNPELLRRLERERSAGRTLLLVTASHALPARAVAGYVKLFDEVLATDERNNLKGERKRIELVRRFGEGGFDYAGNSAADLPVWASAREALVVNAPWWVRRRMGRRGEPALDTRRESMANLLLRALRAHQWAKNLLVFLPLLLAHRYFEPGPLAAAALAFAAFSLGASAVYVFNDLLDVEADRHHPVKRHRPFASGELSVPAGAALIGALGGGSLALALTLPRGFLVVLGLYFGMNVLYTMVLKEVALLDVLVLAGLFTARIMAGSAASDVAVSEWLLAFSVFLFFSLAAVKRYAELLRLRAENDGAVKVRRRGYFSGDLELIVTMGIAAGYMAVLVLALYISSHAVTALYGRPAALWLACPLLLYWISRIWLLAHRGSLSEDPLSFALKDGTTWIAALAGAGIVLAARWGL
jgi:4-hydroxybenzoate polyprenyltransferase/phosphoserine phosphatase